MAVKWLDEPEAHDFDAAAAYLSMVAEDDAVATVVTALKAAPRRTAPPRTFCARLHSPMLPSNNVHVRSDLSKISDGKKLSPILLVRGDAARAVPLQIADGYHRVCAGTARAASPRTSRMGDSFFPSLIFDRSDRT